MRGCPDRWQRQERRREFYEQHPQDIIYARMKSPTEALRFYCRWCIRSDRQKGIP